MPRFVTIKNRVDSIFNDISAYYEIHQNKLIPEESFSKLCIRLSELLSCSPRTIIESIADIKTVIITRKLIYDSLWRLCANLNNLSKDIPVLKHSNLEYNCTEDVRFVSVVPDKRDKDQYILRVQVLTGHYAPGSFKTRHSERGVRRMLNLCGYSGRTYIPGRIEDCLPGLFSRAILDITKPSILSSLLVNSEIQNYNRKYIIKPRDKDCCPQMRVGGCRSCPVTNDICPASYKEAFMEEIKNA